jgi:NitT/TauT family transport system substrate-binding protein
MEKFLGFVCGSSVGVRDRHKRPGSDQDPVALGDVASVKTLCFIVALDRAKDRGVAYEYTAFSKEELAIQAIINVKWTSG